jgi:hypothetical protein
MAALTVWREHPGEIAADLRRYYGVRIADWHSGDMCSYELLELCDFMPGDGAFKTARRGGDPCERDEAILQTANEVAVLRAGMVPGADSDDYGSHLFIPASKLRAMADAAAASEEARDSLTPRVDDGED